MLGEELGAAWGANFDLQIINGAGSNGELTGLLTLGSTTAVTATTATAVANVAAMAKLRDLTSVACGQDVDTLVIHPRRAAFIAGTLGYQWTPPVPGSGIVICPSIPVTLGATTSQDCVLMFPRDRVLLFQDAPKIAVFAEILSGQLTARCEVHSYAALVVKRPESVGKATGAGLASPTYTV